MASLILRYLHFLNIAMSYGMQAIGAIFKLLNHWENLNQLKVFLEILMDMNAFQLIFSKQSITLSSNYSYSYSTTRVGVGTRVVLE